VEHPPSEDRRRGFESAFRNVIDYGQRRGELPPTADANDVAGLLQAVTMDTLQRWAMSERSRRGSLRSALQRHADVVLGGVAAVWPWDGATPDAAEGAP